MTLVEYQVEAAEDDAGFWYNWGKYFQDLDYKLALGAVSGYTYYHGFFRFADVTIPVGATITNAYISVYYYGKSGTPSECKLYFVDAANPSAPTSYDSANGLTLTTEYISFTAPTEGTWKNSDDISAIVQELNDTFDYSSGAAMICVIRSDPSITGGFGQVCDACYSGLGAKLYIEYTEEARGNPFYAYAQQ